MDRVTRSVVKAWGQEFPFRVSESRPANDRIILRASFQQGRRTTDPKPVIGGTIITMAYPRRQSIAARADGIINSCCFHSHVMPLSAPDAGAKTKKATSKP